MTDQDDWFSDTRATFGDRLAAAREQGGLSRDDLARKLGVDPVEVAAWEDDREEPRANRMAMLAGVLGISLAWLMTGQGDGPSAPAEDGPLSGDVTQVLSEMRGLRDEIALASERLGQLESRLRRMLQGAE